MLHAVQVQSILAEGLQVSDELTWAAHRFKKVRNNQLQNEATDERQTIADLLFTNDLRLISFHHSKLYVDVFGNRS